MGERVGSWYQGEPPPTGGARREARGICCGSHNNFPIVFVIHEALWRQSYHCGRVQWYPFREEEDEKAGRFAAACRLTAVS